MARFALLPLLVVLYASLLAVFASPLPINGTVVDLVERSSVGRGTWFHPGLGNCGKWNKDSDLIVAISKSTYGSGSKCGYYVKIEDVANHKTAYGLVRDSCQSCKPNDLDMSPSLFQKFANLNVGVIEISWSYMPKGWHP